MPLIELKGIGKIYVSENNVSVGIRGVDLSFERGEFVAVTGKSGSGKSTLLNVISGMDTYEEGELYIEGEPTSHYLQSDWEEYREKYISFIFQDYNIIESFTVLENVELALMHIEDRKERRARALELLDRVGLTSHLKQKGSRLSGGQKQRTVIARALAKDSPIILADEPTGNLDSATSKEIIELLREVSRDKLLIVVTHNFDEVEEYATRHIRIFDGAVESDRVIYRVAPVSSGKNEKVRRPDPKRERKRELENGFSLGKAIFCAKPKLTLFLCLLMIVGTLGVFMNTASQTSFGDLIGGYYMFNHIDGRVVIAKQSGEVIKNEELEALASKLGADRHLRCDILLDSTDAFYAMVPFGDDGNSGVALNMECTYGEDFGNVVGRYPERADEVLLYLPISYQTKLGKNEIKHDRIDLLGIKYKITGIKYYYDNNITPKCLFTSDGFRTATAYFYLSYYSQIKTSLRLRIGESEREVKLDSCIPSFEVENGKICVVSKDFEGAGSYDEASVSISSIYQSENYDMGEYSKVIYFNKSYDESYISNKKAPEYDVEAYGENLIIVSDEVLREVAEEVLDGAYAQASLFFADDNAAHKAAEELKKMGYIAVPSDTRYEPQPAIMILSVVVAALNILMWLLIIIFFAFFINLCSGRVLSAFKGDMAIMRSMGIQVKVIRIAMYVRMLICLIPAFILVALLAILIYTSPKFNAYFTYLYFWQYLLVYVGMIYMTVRVTRKQIKRLFGESVKRSLTGGED